MTVPNAAYIIKASGRPPVTVGATVFVPVAKPEGRVKVRGREPGMSRATNTLAGPFAGKTSGSKRFIVTRKLPVTCMV